MDSKENGWNGNSFSDGWFIAADAIIRPVAPYKAGVSQAAMMAGTNTINGRGIV